MCEVLDSTANRMNQMAVLLLKMMIMIFGLVLSRNIFYGILKPINHLAFPQVVTLALKALTIVQLALKMLMAEK